MEYPLTDGRVKRRLSTNASQQVTSSNQPDAFGVGSVTAGTASAYAYGGAAGYREDGISPAGLSSNYGFQKVGARYYDPAFGCFLTRDTELGQKPYAYCDGDPVNFNDPSGHDAKTDQAAAAAAAVEMGMLLMGGLAAAAAGAAGEVVQQTISSNGSISLAGSLGITSNQQGNKDTTTVMGSVADGRTTVTGSATNIRTPGSNVTTGNISIGYQLDPNNSFTVGHNFGGGGQVPSWTETFIHKFKIP